MQAVRTGAVVDSVIVRDYGTEGNKALHFADRIEVILQSAADCDEVIRAAMQARAEMDADAQPEPSYVVNWCPAVTELDGQTLYCDRAAGHYPATNHHAPGPDKGSEVAWDDTAAVAS